MRVKLFWKNRPDLPVDKGLSFKNAQDLEDEMNVWLSQNSKIKVVDVKQSASGDLGLSLWLISIWYEEAT